MNGSLEVSPQAIEWLAGERNIAFAGNGAFKVVGFSIRLIRKSDGRTVRFKKFSGGEHDQPNSVKTGWFHWEPMEDFTIPAAEQSRARERALEEKKIRANLARLVL